MSAADGMMLWTNDYLADTQHLTTVQHGAYLLILMAMWRGGGSLPNDEVRLARTARLPMDKWRKVNAEILDLLTIDGNRITQKRLRQELEHTLGRIEKRRTAGRAGGQAKALKSLGSDLAFASEAPVQTDADAPGNRNGMEEERKNLVGSDDPTPCGEGEKAAKKRTKTEPRAYSVEFDEKFWKPYPRTPIMSKAEAWDIWERLSADDRAKAIAALPRYVAYLKSKPDHPAVHACRYLSQRRFEALAEAPSAQASSAPPARPKHGEERDIPGVGKRTYIYGDTDEWSAWAEYLRSQGKPSVSPDRDGGRHFNSRWPPGHLNSPAASVVPLAA
ncbi:MAG TPA: DUF1376 domain-containing protein [Pseudolabrys sp.]|uniref:YdaU family protein n=1 Tax=Pseudolabrys sp. TaxID=1960880 RepID=UPI002DDCE380|nr:DUF1376 domain-containing protein [Pseudolabrys sp.]HEV2629447.1 DUF1376 domain-containing protein [Pseudolabrys sp.]